MSAESSRNQRRLRLRLRLRLRHEHENATAQGTCNYEIEKSSTRNINTHEQIDVTRTGGESEAVEHASKGKNSRMFPSTDEEVCSIQLVHFLPIKITNATASMKTPKDIC